MAPFLDVRSDSWLDLSANAPLPKQKKSEQQQRYYNNNRLFTNSPTNHRHSIAFDTMTSTMLTNELSRFAEEQDERKQNNNRRRPMASSNMSLSQSPTRHLLIRRRQHLFALNKRQQESCSAQSLSSNLSNSIDLLIGSEAPSVSSKKVATQPADSIGRQESRRLSHMRERLARRRKPATGQWAVDRTKQIDGRQSRSPQVLRSLSSLSERLGDKLSNLRHSCKQFLRSRHFSGGSITGQQNDCVISDQMAADQATGEIWQDLEAERKLAASRRRLTGQWVERHCCRPPEADDRFRPKSLDVGSLLVSLSQDRYLKDADYATRIREETTRLREINRKSTTPSLFTSSINKQPTGRPATGGSSRQEVTRSRRHSSQQHEPSAGSSSATLVSLPKEENSTPSLESMISSPASTLNSLSSMSSQKQQTPQQLTTGSQQQMVMQLELAPGSGDLKVPAPMLLAAPTSDYWSTVNSNSDYYKQQVNVQFPQTAEVPVLAPTNMLPLASDQDYYLDVANAALIGQQQPVRSDPRAELLFNQSAAQLLMLQQQQAAQQPPASPLDEDYADEDYAVPADETGCRLDRSQVELVQMIGEGQKGYVFLGKLQSKDGGLIQDVAIKTLKYETEELIEKLMREAAMMRQFEHPHIIRFIGVCPQTPALIAMELAEFGELRQYLRLYSHLLSASQLVLFAFQISTALSYLESKQFVHRDVAARNVLVCSPSCVKLADFGLSRHLVQFQRPPGTAAKPSTVDWTSDEGANYVAAPRGKLPVRWLAPESLVFRRFTSASDVWMFAVCCWELFHFGQQRPWAQIRNNQVLEAVESGQRLARPPLCPARLYQLMLLCWSYAPVKRPKFRELKQQLWSVYLAERARDQMELEQQQQRQQLHLIQLRHEQQLEADRLQQQQQLRRQQQLANLLIGQQQQQRRQQPQLRDEQQVVSSSRGQLQSTSMNSNNNRSPLSGCSSATGNELSRGSSRSPSMGSLAKRKQQQQANSVQVAANFRLPQQSPKSKSPSGNQLMVKQAPAERRQTSASPEARPRNESAAAAVASNMRRFQRAPGHLLQKQRSQGSIVVSSRETTGHCEKQPRGFDDQLIGQRCSYLRQQQQPEVILKRRSHQRPLSELHLAGPARHRSHQRVADEGHEADADDDDEDDADISSSSDQDTTFRMQPPAQRSAVGAGSNNNLSERLGQLHLGQMEQPTYEGLQRGHEVAMIKGLAEPLPVDCLSQVEQIRGCEAAARLREQQKLANIIEALKLAPMKAKLRHHPNNQAEDSEATAIDPVARAKQEEEQRLALHRRLLGHIRAGSRVAGGRQQQPVATTSSRPEADDNKRKGVETVDQSLELLESLISERGFEGSSVNRSNVAQGNYYLNQAPTQRANKNNYPPQINLNRTR